MCVCGGWATDLPGPESGRAVGLDGDTRAGVPLDLLLELVHRALACGREPGLALLEHVELAVAGAAGALHVVLPTQLAVLGGVDADELDLVPEGCAGCAGGSRATNKRLRGE